MHGNNTLQIDAKHSYQPTFGPLTKNQASYLCDRLLPLLYNSNYKTTFKIINNEFIVTFSPTNINTNIHPEEFNLNLLFRYANLQHLALKNKDIAVFEKLIKENQTFFGLSDEQIQLINSDAKLPQLSFGEKAALLLYTRKHKFINLLLRGETIELTTYLKDNEFNEFYSQIVMREALIITLIATHSNNKLVGKKTKKVFRVEEDKESMVNTLNRRIKAAHSPDAKKIISCSGFFSTSRKGLIYEDGVNTYNIFWLLKSSQLSIASISGHPDECEVMLSHGAQILIDEHFSTLNYHLFTGREVNTPDGITPDEYFSQLTLRYLLPHLLSPYSEPDFHATINGKIIQRPNHALVHTTCVMELIASDIAYFSNHAKNSYFKYYCQKLSTYDRSLLKIVAGFLKVHRRNEDSFFDNKDEFEKSQAESAKEFVRFAKKFLRHIIPNQFLTNHKIYQLAKVIRNFSNPDFRQQQQNTELGHIAEIMNMAHNLHLMRCYVAEDYLNRVIEPILAISLPSNKQRTDLFNLLRLTQAFIDATGDRRMFTVKSDGILDEKNSREYYKSPFDICSLNIEVCSAVLVTARQKNSLNSFSAPFSISKNMRILSEYVLGDILNLDMDDLSITLTHILQKPTITSNFSIIDTIALILLVEGRDLPTLLLQKALERLLIETDKITGKCIDLQSVIEFSLRTESKPIGVPNSVPSLVAPRNSILSSKIPISHLLALSKAFDMIYALTKVNLNLDEVNEKQQTLFLFLINSEDRFNNPIDHQNYLNFISYLLNKKPQRARDQDINGNSALHYIVIFNLSDNLIKLLF